MLAYDHAPSVLPWLAGMQLHQDSSHVQLSDAAALSGHNAGLDQQSAALALAALSPQSLGPMDALQSILLQGAQGMQAADNSASPTTPADLTQMLAQFSPPGLDQLSSLATAASSPQHLLHTDASSSSPPMTQSWAPVSADHINVSSPNPGLPCDQQSSTAPRVFVPESLKAAASSTPPNLQALLQAALGQQQPGIPGAADAANLLPLLHEQLLMQSLQQQTATQPNIQAALAAALSAGASAAPPGLGQPPLASALANSTGSLRPFVPPSMADPTAAAAATAAALLAAQQQQQQAAVNRALASTDLLGGVDTNALLQLVLSQQGLAANSPAAGSAAASVINQLQPWAIKALTAQMQQQGAASSLAAFNQQQLAIANLLNSTATAGSLPRPAPLPQGRRSRTGRRSSGTAAVAPDLASSFGFASRAGSVAGSDAGEAKAVPAVLPAGVTVQDLCPTKYEDTWGTDDAATTTTTTNAVNTTTAAFSTDGSCHLARGTSSASSSSIDSVTEGPSSLCGSALSLSSASRTASGDSAEDKWQWDSHFCSLDEDAAAKGASGVAGRACRKGAAAQVAKASQGNDAAPVEDQDNKTTTAAAGGCPVWIPGAREAAGDDSWYLPRPVTCRLFVGNIGCWVDESMLLAYFGKYGHVVDVQVMWNTKMLARGRRVNREFAFISYSNPLEAARAVHWLDGCRLPDLEKDKNGVTVEYENGEGDGPAAK